MFCFEKVDKKRGKKKRGKVTNLLKSLAPEKKWSNVMNSFTYNIYELTYI